MTGTTAHGPVARGYMGIARVISRHMVFLAPLCVITGAAFPQLFTWIQPAVAFLFACMTFQSSMGTTTQSLLDVIRHPKRLLGCLLVLLVGMPLLSFALGRLLLGGNDDILAGIVLEYCVPMGVTGLIWTDIYHGNKSLSLAVCIISTVIAPFSLPVVMHLLLGASIEMDMAKMMLDLLLMVALPALLGMGVNDLSHGKANAQLAPWLASPAKVILIIVLCTNSTHLAGPVRNFTPELLLAAALMAFLGLIGYFAGYAVARMTHSDVNDSFAMGICTGCRNISSGAVIAASYFPATTMFPVLMGTMFQHVIAALYGWAVRRLEAGNTPRSVTRLQAQPGEVFTGQKGKTTAHTHHGG